MGRDRRRCVGRAWWGAGSGRRSAALASGSAGCVREFWGVWVVVPQVEEGWVFDSLARLRRGRVNISPTAFNAASRGERDPFAVFRPSGGRPERWTAGGSLCRTRGVAGPGGGRGWRATPRSAPRRSSGRGRMRAGVTGRRGAGCGAGQAAERLLRRFRGARPMASRRRVYPEWAAARWSAGVGVGGVGGRPPRARS